LTGLLFSAEDVCDISSETSGDIQGTIPEDTTLHNHRCENLKYETLTEVRNINFVADTLYVHVVYTVSLSSAVVIFMNDAYLEELLDIKGLFCVYVYKDKVIPVAGHAGP
jgi:hypothetical protein